MKTTIIKEFSKGDWDFRIHEVNNEIIKIEEKYKAWDKWFACDSTALSDYIQAMKEITHNAIVNTPSRVSSKWVWISSFLGGIGGAILEGIIHHAH